jgi:hypothetical protein
MTDDPRPYERRLRDSFDLALREASAHFGAAGAVHETLTRLAARLDAEGIPYALIGALAAAAHGYVRMTTDVDLVMTADGLARFHECCVGRGYRPAFPGAAHTFRDVETQVRIEVVTSGAFPGDGLPKPVAFPDPAEAIVASKVRVVPLATLVELKLASGLSAPGRLKDLADVQEMIRTLELPLALADELDDSVAGLYADLWHAVRDTPDPYDEERAAGS